VLLPKVVLVLIAGRLVTGEIDVRLLTLAKAAEVDLAREVEVVVASRSEPRPARERSDSMRSAMVVIGSS
jgi:hypothetical protein